MGWLIACILAVVLFNTQRRLKQLTVRYQFQQLTPGSRSQPDSDTSPSARASASVSEFLHRNLSGLIILRLELGRLLAEREIDHAFYEQAVEQLDALGSVILSGLGAVPGNEQWQQGREAAWELLSQHQPVPLGPPPWHSAEQAKEQHERALRSQAEEIVLQTVSPRTAVSPAETLIIVNDPHPPAQVPETVPGPMTPESLVQPKHLRVKIRTGVDVPPRASAPAVQPTHPQTTSAPSLSPASLSQREESSPLSTSTSDLDETESYAWKSTEPSALEHALQAVSGWPALIAPFLAQNIGWFIGGFCFMAGSIFLVSYTTGFTKALTVFAALFTYTLFLLWAGYQLRRRQPELEASSSVLMTLGVLLVPLNIAATVRLIETGQGFPWLSMIGVLAAACGLGGLYFATTLVSGVMDRSLQGRHPQIFLALAAMQLAVPLLTRLPYWPMLALLHLILLGLLAYGLVLFVQDWIHSIFVERRKIAYYAAGTLVYAALISFVHLAWGSGEPLALPGGYYSPFLMALCGLLFYVDAQFKQWTNQYPFLSRFSFAVYGLSVLALFLSVNAPIARILTLLLAIGLYGMVVWQYLTLPPLYLLLACLSWLYSSLILQYLPNDWYFLASLPGLAGLFTFNRWALRRRSTALALVCYRLLAGLVFGLATWSLCCAQPGLVAMGTTLGVMGLTFYGLKFAPAPLFGSAGVRTSSMYTGEGETHVDLRNGPCLYTVTLVGSVALAYMPQWTGLTWATQFAFGLVLLTLVWSTLGLSLRRTAREAGAAQVEVLLNSGLLTLWLSLLMVAMLTMPGITQNRAIPLLLATGGGVLLWLSLELCVQWLFYGVLMLWGASGAIVKLTYFPAPSAGAVTMLLALAVWGLLWWLEREPDEVAALRREQAELLAVYELPLTLLWWFPVSTQPQQDNRSSPHA